MQRTEVPLASTSRRLIVFTLFVTALGFSQVIYDGNQNLPLFGSFHASSMDSVSLQNGNLHIELPIVKAPQRAGHDFTWTFVYDTQSWQKIWVSQPTPQNPKAGIYQVEKSQDYQGWVLQNSSSWHLTGGFLSTEICPGFSQPLSVWTNWALTDPHGIKHPLQLLTASSTPGPESTTCAIRLTSPTLDGTGAWVDFSQNPALIILKDGTHVITTLNTLEDSNGNFFSSTSDTLQRNLLAISNATNITYTSPGGRNIVGPQSTTWQTVDSNGKPETYTLNYAAIDYQTSFCGGGSGCSEAAGVLLVPSTFTLPNPNRTEQIQFSWYNNSGGELKQVTLPTGSYISYTYANSCIGETGGGGNIPFDCRRSVVSRTVNIDGVNSTWSYNSGTITDPNNNDEQHVFGIPSGYSSSGTVETDVYRYSGTGTSRTLLQHTHTDYTADPSVNGGGFVQDIRPIDVITTLDSGLQKETTLQYDTFSYGGVAVVQNILNKKEYDYGSGSPGALLRTTAYTYWHDSHPSYVTANIVDRIATETISDGNGTTVAQTNYQYDTTTVAGNAGVANHDDNAYTTANTTRGNRTQVSRWDNTDSSSITTTNTFDQVGNLVSSVGNSGQNPTTFSYADTWQAAGCVGANTQAYLTQQTNPLGQNTQMSYYPCTGLIGSRKDQNDINSNRAGITYTYDFMNRIVGISYADGGHTGIDYNADALPLTATVTQLASPDPSVVTSTVYDGFGRVKTTRTDSDPEGVDYVDTTYDAVGNVLTKTNAHRLISDPTSAMLCFGTFVNGQCISGYDGMGRPTTITEQDGGIVRTSYPGNTVTTTDETQRQRRTYTDGVGRLVQVDEPGPPGTPAKAGSGSLNIASVTGGVQSKVVGSSPAVAATGSVTIAGAQGFTYVSPCSNPRVRSTCTQFYPSTQITVTVYGISTTANVGGDSTTAASEVASAINGNGSSPVTASWSSGSSIVYLTAKTGGVATDYSLSTSVYHVPNQYNFNSTFTSTASGANLTGGADANPGTTIYDQGSVALSMPGCTVSAPYSQSQNYNPSLIAAALASAMGPAGCPVIANASGASILLTANSAGSSTDYTITGTASWDTTDFSQPSFSSPGTTLSGGADPGPGGLDAPYTTVYQYDALDNLICVEEHGGTSGTGCSSPSSSDATSPWRVRRFKYDSLSRLTSASNPESGTVQYSYAIDTTCNPDGLLRSMTDGRGKITTYCYDLIHRLTKKTYSDGSAAREFFYDAAGHGSSIGRLTHASNDVNAAYDPSYDSMGRVVSQTYCIPSDCSYGVSVSAQYNLAGNLDWLTYPDGRKIQNLYNGAGRITKVNYDSFNGTAVGAPFFTIAQSTDPSSWGYAPSGSLQRATFGNNVAQVVGYNSRLQLSSINQSTSTQTLFSKNYSYADSNNGNGNNGNVFAISDNLSSSRNQTFGYDQLNRLISGAQSDGAFNQSFSYDAWGNLQQSGTWTFQSQFTLQNRLQGYSYDASGDLLSDGFHNYAYDAERRLITVDDSGATYTYGPDGERVRKDTGGNFREYIYFGADVVAEKTSGGWTDYIFANHERVAMNSSSAMSATQYYHADHLGSTRIMTDASANVISNCLYAPFGQESSCSPSNAANHYKFTGKERDSESNLDYFGARYMSSTMGRFMQPDGPSDQDPENPQSWNLYTYTLNNPLRYTDPDGQAHTDANGFWVGDKDGECGTQNGRTLCWNAQKQEWQAPPPKMDNGGVNPGFLGPGDIFFVRIPDLGIASKLGSIFGRTAEKAVATTTEKAAASTAEEALRQEVQGLVSKAATTVGNQGVQASSREAAEQAATEWVGQGARDIVDRNTGQSVGKISADGTRVARFTSVGKAQPYINLVNKTTGGNLHVRF